MNPDLVLGCKVLARLHEGQRSVILRVRRVEGDVVILKLPSTNADHAERVPGLLREHETLLKLSGTRGVVDVVGLLRQGGGLGVCLRDSGGASLRERSLAARLPLPNFLELALAMAEVLHRVHERGVVHGDFQPSNIILGATPDSLELIDFASAISGGARDSSPPLGSLKTVNALAYASPERIGRLGRVVDHRADYYSLGVTLFELLTGTLPFCFSDPLELAHAQVARQPPHPSDVVRGVPEEVSNIILRLLSKELASRYPGMEPLREELLAAQEAVKHTSRPLRPGRVNAEGFRARNQSPLHGRETELAKLEKFLTSACAGKAVFVSVAGEAGVGKSALVKRLGKSVVARGGYFVAGKFEQFGGAVAHGALGQALDVLSRQLLANDPDELDALRQRVDVALGGFGAALVEICPALEQVIGKQPALPPLPINETRARLQRALGSFLAASAAPEHPLCLFLDDVHWAQPDSVSLISHLLAASKAECLMIVVAYREEELSAVRGLDAAIADLQALEIPTAHLRVEPLSQQDLKGLVSSLFGGTEADCEGLAEITWARTRGNPFFVHAFLESLRSEGLMRVGSSGSWVKLDLVKQRSVTDNVVSLLVERINRLPLGTQAALCVAANIGSTFDLATLRIAAKSVALEDIWPAARAELVFPDGRGGSGSYRFAHDRVQQAAAGMLEPIARQRVRLDIGQHLLVALSPDELSRRLFEVVAHLNDGLPLVSDPKLRREIAALNLRASRVALAQAAGDGGLELAQKGIEALREARWSEEYQLARDLHLVAAEAAFAWARHDVLAQLATTMVENARDALDAVRVQRLQGRVYQAQSRTAEAVATYVTALAAIGVVLPPHPDEDDVRSELEATATLMRERRIEDFLNEPECRDELGIVAMELLAKLIFFGYSSGSRLFAVAVCRLVRTSLERGVVADTANGLTFYGLLRSREEEDLDAHRYGTVALALSHRFGNPSVLSQVYLYVHYQLMHWKTPLRELQAPLRRAYEFGLAAGSPLNAGCSATTLCICRFWSGDQLGPLAEELDHYRSIIIQFRQTLVRNWHEILQQTVANLRTPSAQPHCLDGPFYQESSRLPQHQSRGDNSALFNYHLAKTFLCYLFGDYEAAVLHTERTENFPTIRSAIWAIPAVYLDCLCRLAVCDEQGAVRREHHLQRVQQNLTLLEKWRERNPNSIEHKILTVDGALARLNGDDALARRCFARAIDLARDNGFPPEEGIACELAASLADEQGDRAGHRYYLRRAHRSYALWGADAKVKALEQAHPELRSTLLSQAMRDSSFTEQSLDGFDFLAVLNASRAISSEVKVDRLLERIMGLLIGVAGGETGYLLVAKEGVWVVEAASRADASLEGAAVNHVLRQPSLTESGISTSVVNYVAETAETVLLDDASSSERFSRDAHIASSQVASLLCFPLRMRGITVGIVYLENNLARGAFTASKVKLLELISAQAVISLENARLYEASEQKVEARTSQLKERNDQLAGTLDELMKLQEQLVAQEKLAALGLLTAGIAHEIKNPLNFVINFASESERLLEELASRTSSLPKDDEARELVADLRLGLLKIGEHGRRASDIVGGMALHARDGRGRRQIVDLNHAVQQSVALSVHGFRANGGINIAVDAEYDPAIGELELVPEDISRVFLNLISNARQAVEEKQQCSGAGFLPRIKVSTKALGDSIEVHVRDNGVGIPRMIADKIFVPFFTTKPSGQGTGLGLSISRDIARAHGGALRVESVDGEFTEVVLALPRRPSATVS